MWKVIEGPSTVKLTKSLAKQFADMPHIKRDRPLNPSRLRYHREQLDAGKFRSPEWATAVCKEDGVEYRVNGQHTSAMLAETSSELLHGLKAIVTRYECPTLEDVATLWATFDSKYSARTSQDIYGAFAGACPELDGINRSLLSAIAAGLGLSVDPNKVSTGNISAEEKGRMLISEVDFVLWAAPIVGKDIRLLKRAAVTCAMYDTWKKNRADANVFWRLVLTGEGPKPSDPDRKLQMYLTETNVAFGNGIRSSVRKASAREIYSKCIHAWNAWRKGVSTELKYYSEAKVPKAA